MPLRPSKLFSPLNRPTRLGDHQTPMYAMNDPATERLRASIEALNARIARLAIGLGLSLDKQSDLDQLLEQTHGHTSGQQGTALKLSSGHREGHQRNELRGLLILRYRLEADTLSDIGLDATREVFEKSRDNLISRGFKPGADGSVLSGVLDAV